MAQDPHELIGVADAGFGDQAYCSCGWRTAPKPSSWEASTVWHAHMTASLRGAVMSADG
jgi:hypothetical protein